MLETDTSIQPDGLECEIVINNSLQLSDESSHAPSAVFPLRFIVATQLP